jgi:hypothetical protein
VRFAVCAPLMEAKLGPSGGAIHVI